MTAIADRVKLSFQEESTYGVNPGGTFQELRLTSESLSTVTDTTTSTELRPDRQVTCLIRNGIRVNGGFDFELSYASFDVLLAALLFSADFPVETELLGVNGNTEVVITASSGNIQAVGVFTSSSLVGKWLELSNFSNAANNTLVKVLSKTDNDNIVVAGLAALADETRAADGAGANGKIDLGSQIENGTNQRSFTFEKHFTDVTQFAVFLGCVIASFSLNMSADQVITGSFGILGKTENPLAGTTSGGGQTAANTNKPMNAIDNVLGVIEGTPAVNANNEFFPTAFSLSMDNNLRERLVIGELGPQSIGAGKVAVSGTMQAFFNSQAAADKYLNDTETAISAIFSDNAGNRYVIDLPRVKFSNGQKVAGGENSDILLDMAFTAYMHETELTTIRIARFPAA